MVLDTCRLLGCVHFGSRYHRSIYAQDFTEGGEKREDSRASPEGLGEAVVLTVAYPGTEKMPGSLAHRGDGGHM